MEQQDKYGVKPDSELEVLRRRVAELEQQIGSAQDASRALLMLDSIKDYAIYMLDPYGRVLSWSAGAERMHGYRSEKIIGQPLANLYAAEGLQRGLPDLILATASEEGRCEIEDWLVHRDGSRFWANTIVAALRDQSGGLLGFSVVTRDMTERKQAEEMIRYHAYHDPLTGLPNRSLLNDRMALAMAHARRSNHVMGVLFFDLDRFKTINDTLGHAVGDLLLKQVAERVSACIRATDTLVRLGGDEFVLIISQINKVSDGAIVAQKIIDALAQPFLIRDQELYTSTSIGLSFFPQDGEDSEILLKNADTALYRAKDSGRNNFQLYSSDMNAQSFERLAMEHALRKALENDTNNELQIYYQPQIDLSSGQIVSVEALLRWQHPYLGVIAPGAFIPLAEEAGLMGALETWVLRTACAYGRALQDAGLGPLRVAVNLSIRRFRQQDLLQAVRKVLEETGIEPQRLELEISETAAMQDESFTIDTFRELKALGIHISIDDFGTGYSSFNYLRGALVDTIKIDHSFIREIGFSSDSRAITFSIIRLAHSLKLQAVAEGVETEEQLALLQSEGCDKIQGYLFSKPLPTDALIRLLSEQQHRPWLFQQPAGPTQPESS